MTDEAGVEHRLWAVEADGSLAAAVERERLLIADGHHRYTMALRYQEEMRAGHGPGPWDAVMMLVVDGATEDPPILPIHRVLVSGQVAEVGARVRDLEEVLAGVDDELPSVGLATWEEGELVHRVCRLHSPPPAVCALHTEILDTRGSTEMLRYVPDAVEAEASVRARDAVGAFFLPPTKVERIRPIVERGERLPEKSTFFWPKPRTGMVLRPLDPLDTPTSSPPPPPAS
jgi:uncharacterized protein (DUF1015 family)